jgi:hypothetical protein
MSNDHEEHKLDWKGQEIIVRWCPEWLGGDTARLEIVTVDRSPHPISETGYCSHFCSRELVLSQFCSGLFRAMFAMKEIWNCNEIHRRVSA